MKKQIPELFFRAEIMPATWNKDTKTVEVVFSTGAEVRRGGFWEDDYLESLSLEPAAVRLDRLKRGAPVLDSHRSYGLGSVIGVVESASVDGKQGVAKIRFSDRPEVQGVVKDIENKILRNVSVGYVVHKYVETPATGDNKMKRLLATDWEPYEISFVALPADAGAQVRKAEELFDCEIVLNERKDMADELKKTAAAPVSEPTQRDAPVAPPLVDAEKIRQEAIAAERQRVAEISGLVKRAGFGQEVADDLVKTGSSIEQTRTRLFDLLVERTQQAKINNGVRVEMTGQDETVTRRDAVKSALLHRFNGGKYELIEPAKKYRARSLLEVARLVLAWRGDNVDSLSKNDLAIRALHSTSDFPAILADVSNKTLRDGYTSTPQTFTPFVRFVTATDFKPMYRIALGDAPKLKKLKENGEYTYGTIGESSENYKIDTFGRIISISRKTIINDDLNAFTRIPQMYGVQAANLESDLVWAIIIDNAAMGDGVLLFHATHKNLAGAGAAISVTSLSAARVAMKSQKGIASDGTDKKEESHIVVNPTHLVVPLELETVAQQFVAQNIKVTSTKASDVNPFAGNLEVAAETRLSENSASAWYVFSNSSQTDMIEVATLDGQRGPVQDVEPGFDVDGIKLKATYDIGGGVVDYRGFYKNPGV